MCLMLSVALWIYWFSFWGYSKYWPKIAVFIYILLVLCQSILLLAVNQDLLHNVFSESLCIFPLWKSQSIVCNLYIFLSFYIFLDGCSAYCLQAWFYIIVILKLHDHGIFQIKGWRQHSAQWYLNIQFMLVVIIWPVVQSFSNLSAQRSSRDFRIEASKH